MMKRMILVTLMIAIAATGISAEIIDFDELTLDPETHVNDTAFTSGSASFEYNSGSDINGWFWWSGFGYSNETETTEGGYSKEFDSFAGGARSGDNFAACYMPVGKAAPRVHFSKSSKVNEMYVTNNTYAALSMLNGDAFAKKFGGTTGYDKDWFKLTIQGFDEYNSLTGTVDFYLADFRSDNDEEDYVVDTWEMVDLTSLGYVSSLAFSVSSTDVGNHGMNTPAYFLMDDLNITPVPEPATVALLGLGGFLLRRKRNA